MTIYVIEPDTISPASRFGGWLGESGEDYKRLSMPTHADIVDELVALLASGDSGAVSGLIHCGGRQSALSGDEHPWINSSMALYKECLRLNIPVLGICLGHQILAHTFGGDVLLDSEKHGEEGAVTLTLHPAGANDPLLGGLAELPAPVTVYESHHDYVERIPEGATLLASSERCPVEAFRYGSAVGIQFHPEASPDEITTWIKSEYPEDQWEERIATALALTDTLLDTGWAVFQGFLGEVRAHRAGN